MIQSTSWMLALLLACAGSPRVAFAEPSCQPSTVEHHGDVVDFDIDQVWSGTRVAFSGVSIGRRVVMAYYDRDRYLTVAELDLDKRQVCRVQLQSRFAGWDSHNATSLALASDGSIHLAANMHASQLVYARSDLAGALASFKLSPMTGKDEDHVTYPTFVGGGASPLSFMYRSGRSGEGDWVVDNWNGTMWRRVGQIFSATSSSGHVSAYPSPLVRDSKGQLHFAIVWRRTPMIESNFAISYARTSDLKTWFGSTGRQLTVPLTVDGSDVIEKPGENTGLVNNARLVLDSKGVPVIFYTRYAEDGRNILIAARPDQAGWTVKEIARSAGRTDLKGGGSIAELPGFGAEVDHDDAKVAVIFPGEKKIHLRMSLLTLQASEAVATPQPSERESEVDFQGLADPVHVAAPVVDGRDPARIKGRLMWTAQAPNRDRPRSCEPPNPQACDPHPTMLRFRIAAPNSAQ